MIIDIVRHGQSEGNSKGIIQGQYDLPLTDEGKEQAIQLGKSLTPNYDAVFSSPLSRAYDTAKLALQASDIGLEIIKLDELMEMNFGVLQGQIFQENDEAIREIFRRGKSDPSFRFEGGETGMEFIKRISSGFEKITKTNHKQVLVFTHGGVIQTFNRVFLDIKESVVSNTAISRFEFQEGKYTKL